MIGIYAYFNGRIIFNIILSKIENLDKVKNLKITRSFITNIHKKLLDIISIDRGCKKLILKYHIVKKNKSYYETSIPFEFK